MTPTVHASCVVAADAGVLIRGPSGSGKSSLAAALIEQIAATGQFAALVADDRVRLTPAHGRVIATAPASLAGLIERRGLGVVAADWIREAVIRLVVDIEAAPPRLPEPESAQTEVVGVRLPRLAVACGGHNGASLVQAGLRTWFWRKDFPAPGLAFAPQHEKMTTFPRRPPRA